MIRSTYLVARRDYLGYVSAWGFWLGLLFTPIILGIFILAPTFAQNAQPTRYYTIIEQGRQREVYNWLQYFTPETLRQEASSAGFDIEALYGDVAGHSYQPEAREFAVVLR